MERTIFFEISKDLDTSLKIILLNHQNNYIEKLNTISKKFCDSSLNILHNYFDDPRKFFSDLYLAKFLDFNKPFFPCRLLCFNRCRIVHLFRN